MNLSNTYANVGGTIYNKQTQKKFSNASDFFMDSGQSSFNGLIFDTAYKPTGKETIFGQSSAPVLGPIKQPDTGLATLSSSPSVSTGGPVASTSILNSSPSNSGQSLAGTLAGSVLGNDYLQKSTNANNSTYNGITGWGEVIDKNQSPSGNGLNYTGTPGSNISYGGQTIGGFDGSGSPFGFGVQTGSGSQISADIPDEITPSKALGQGPTNSDILASLQKHLDMQDQLFASLGQFAQVPQSEIDLQGKAAKAASDVNSLQAQAGGAYNPSGNPDLAFVTGSARNALYSAQLQQQISQMQLAYAQGNRQFAFNSAKDIFNASRNTLDDMIKIYQAAAPQNLGTNYNPTTGQLTAIMRNPLTGDTYAGSLGNIGKQRTFTSTNIATDPMTGALTFVGTTSDGDIVQQPISGGGGTYNPQQGGQFSGQFNSSPTGLTTPAAVNNNPGNLRDPQTGAWQKFATPQEGFQALMNDLQLKQTGKSRTGLNGNSTLSQFTSVYAPASDGNDPAGYAQTIAKQLGVSVNTPIGQIPTAALAAAVAQHEDGKYWNAITTGNSSVAMNLPPTAQKYVETLPNASNSEYINVNRVPDNLKNAVKNLSGGAVPVLTDSEVSAVKSLSQTINNLESLRELSQKVLGGRGVGSVGSSISNFFQNNVPQLTGDDVGKFNSFRETAIKAIQGLAGGAPGLRINNSEIDAQVKNLPGLYDSKELANAKIDQVQAFLQNALKQIIPHAQFNSIKPSGNDATALLNQLLSQYALR